MQKNLSDNDTLKVFLTILYRYRMNTIESAKDFSDNVINLTNKYKDSLINDDLEYDLIITAEDREQDFYREEIKILESYINFKTDKKIKINVKNTNLILDQSKSSNNEKDSNELKDAELIQKAIQEEFAKIEEFNLKIEKILKKGELIEDKDIDELINTAKSINENIERGELEGHNINKSIINTFNDFSNNLDKINDIITNMDFLKYNQNKIDQLIQFAEEIPKEYISNEIREIKIRENATYLDKIKYLEELPFSIRYIIYPDKKYSKFINIYGDLVNYEGLNSEKKNIIKDLNNQFLEKEIDENREFFNINGLQLDDDQIKAILIDEDEIEVIAGAGTGKTLTIQGKVKYLVEKKGVDPNNIIGLSFSKASARELEKRINKAFSDEYKKEYLEKSNPNYFPIYNKNIVQAKTFHAFARDIISTAVKKHLTRNLTKDDNVLDKSINDFFNNLRNNEKSLEKIIEFFGYYFNVENEAIEKEEIDNEINAFSRGMDLRTLKAKIGEGKDRITLNGESVRSLEELRIANYLFIHKIDYVYEDDYKDNYEELIRRFKYSYNASNLNINIKNKTKDEIFDSFIKYENGWLSYTPDFYFPIYNAYLEHYGCNREGHFPLAKNKQIDQDYYKKFENKRIYHKIHETNYYETFSYYQTEGQLLEKLEEKLRDLLGLDDDEELSKRDYYEIFETIKNDKLNDDYKRFFKLIKTFIQNFEANNFSKDSFKEFREKNYNENKDKFNYTYERNNIFLEIVENIYNSYYETMKNTGKISSNREIIKGIEFSKYFDKEIEYIIVDEFQDISNIRFDLIKSIKDKNNSKLFVVGDDWQSIYGFGGSDINLFTNFKEMFPNSEITAINLTYRNSEKLNQILNKFITKNKTQNNMKKIKSNIKNQGDEFENDEPVRIHRYGNRIDKVLQLQGIIEEIERNYEDDDLEILLLSRANDDINDYVGNHLFKKKEDNKIEYTKKKELDIEFLSIHKAKGLEKSEVVILNFEDKINGFPNKIMDDPVLNFVKINKESFPYAEERRLFYVALSRTKNNNYLMVPEFGESEFIKEIKNDEHVVIKEKFDYSSEDYDRLYEQEKKKGLEIFETNATCPNCGRGKVILIINYQDDKIKKFFSCSNKCIDYKTGESWGGGPCNPNYEIEDIKYITPCPNPNCDGVLLKRKYPSGYKLGCSFFRQKGCKTVKPLHFAKKNNEN